MTTWAGQRNAGPEYDPVVEGSWCHFSSGYMIGDLKVSISSSTDLAGNDNEPRLVFVNGTELTVEEATELAKVLLTACNMLASA